MTRTCTVASRQSAAQRRHVPLVALDRQHRGIGDELRAAFDHVVASSAFTLGEEVEAFEADWSEYCGVRHCVGVSSGTAALRLMFEAAGIGKGDEVIVPAHTFIASAIGVALAGATPVLADVDPTTALLDPRAAEAAVTSRSAAILAVHLYGQPCDMDGLGAVARRHGLRLFEDAAQAHGATRDGARAGSLGDAAAFSFYPSKNLGALGDAGGICTDDDELARRARSLRDLGQVRKGKHVHLAGHDRLDALQAAFLSVKLPHLDTWNAARRRHASRYRQLLGPALGTLREDPRCVPNYHVFPVLSEERDACLSVLHGRGIAAGVHYTPALHRQRALARFANRGPFPEAERWARTEFSLPMFAELRKDEIQAIAAACAAAIPEGETREHATV